jgi:hypothetical protein
VPPRYPIARCSQEEAARLARTAAARSCCSPHAGATGGRLPCTVAGAGSRCWVNTQDKSQERCEHLGVERVGACSRDEDDG